MVWCPLCRHCCWGRYAEKSRLKAQNRLTAECFETLKLSVFRKLFLSNASLNLNLGVGTCLQSNCVGRMSQATELQSMYSVLLILCTLSPMQWVHTKRDCSSRRWESCTAFSQDASLLIVDQRQVLSFLLKVCRGRCRVSLLGRILRLRIVFIKIQDPHHLRCLILMLVWSSMLLRRGLQIVVCLCS